MGDFTHVKPRTNLSKLTQTQQNAILRHEGVQIPKNQNTFTLFLSIILTTGVVRLSTKAHRRFYIAVTYLLTLNQPNVQGYAANLVENIFLNFVSNLKVEEGNWRL